MKRASAVRSSLIQSLRSITGHWSAACAMHACTDAEINSDRKLLPLMTFVVAITNSALQLGCLLRNLRAATSAKVIPPMNMMTTTRRLPGAGFAPASQRDVLLMCPTAALMMPYQHACHCMLDYDNVVHQNVNMLKVRAQRAYNSLTWAAFAELRCNFLRQALLVHRLLHLEPRPRQLLQHLV